MILFHIQLCADKDTVMQRVCQESRKSTLEGNAKITYNCINRKRGVNPMSATRNKNA